VGDYCFIKDKEIFLQCKLPPFMTDLKVIRFPGRLINLPWNCLSWSPISSRNITPWRQFLYTYVPVAFKLVCRIFFKRNNWIFDIKTARYFRKTCHLVSGRWGRHIDFFTRPRPRTCLALTTTRFSGFPCVCSNRRHILAISNVGIGLFCGICPCSSQDFAYEILKKIFLRWLIK